MALEGLIYCDIFNDTQMCTYVYILMYYLVLLYVYGHICVHGY